MTGHARRSATGPTNGHSPQPTAGPTSNHPLPSAAATDAAVIGLDLGGTKIAAALLGPDGTVLARHTRPTPARDGAAAVLDALAGAAAAVDPGRLAIALGIAAAGVVDPRTGMVTSGTLIVVLLVGFDVPARLNRLADPDAVWDHLAGPPAAERGGATDPAPAG
ncbi:hypothetical protein GCM10010433_31290 [Streptomyces pulveraceus]|uniref:ROK family protein n=1 Tax=Streptomyces pulveraceus TaxID=68258 RepID=A0ABW1GWJ9_9ACTN